LWGGAAGAAIAAATALALAERNRRKDEEARQARAAQAEAARRNAAEAARKAQEAQAARQARRLLGGGDPLPDDAPFRDRAFHAGKLATAAHNVKVAWAKRQQRDVKLAELAASEAEPPVDVQAGLRALYEGRKAGEVEAQQPWWKRAGEWVATQLDNVAEAIGGLKSARAVRHLRFRRLTDGHISVSADRPPGMRLDYRQLVAEEGFLFKGTRYNPEMVAKITGDGLLKGARSIGSLLFAGAVSFVQNMFMFGEGKKFGSPEYWDATVKNREFWVSAVVDTFVSFAVGFISAALVAGFIAVAAPVVPFLALPAVAIGLTAVTGIVLGSIVDADLPNTTQSFPEWAKTWINRRLSRK
jgi:hypothetical protein